MIKDLKDFIRIFIRKINKIPEAWVLLVEDESLISNFYENK